MVQGWSWSRFWSAWSFRHTAGQLLLARTTWVPRSPNLSSPFALINALTLKSRMIQIGSQYQSTPGEEKGLNDKVWGPSLVVWGIDIAKTTYITGLLRNEVIREYCQRIQDKSAISKLVEHIRVFQWQDKNAVRSQRPGRQSKGMLSYEAMQQWRAQFLVAIYNKPHQSLATCMPTTMAGMLLSYPISCAAIAGSLGCMIVGVEANLSTSIYSMNSIEMTKAMIFTANLLRMFDPFWVQRQAGECINARVNGVWTVNLEEYIEYIPMLCIIRGLTSMLNEVELARRGAYGLFNRASQLTLWAEGLGRMPRQRNAEPFASPLELLSIENDFQMDRDGQGKIGSTGSTWPLKVWRVIFARRITLNSRVSFAYIVWKLESLFTNPNLSPQHLISHYFIHTEIRYLIDKANTHSIFISLESESVLWIAPFWSIQ